MTWLFGSRSDAVTAVVTLAILALVPLYVIETGGTYRARLIELFLVFAIIAMGLNIVFAHTDQLFLFSGALAGISTYTTVVLLDAVGTPIWVLVPVGALVAGLIGALVSYVASRLEMTIIVIAILTLSLQLVAEEYFEGARDVTGGTTGLRFDDLQLTAVEEALGASSQIVNYYLMLLVLAGSFVLYSRMMRSRYGLAFDAIRQDRVAAEAVGINVTRYKVIAAFTGAALIGLVGPFYATAQGRVTPSDFAFLNVDVFVLIVIVLGGMRTMLGPVVGSGLLILINEELDVFGQWELSVFGLLLIGLFLYFSDGVVPFLADVARTDPRTLPRRSMEWVQTSPRRLREWFRTLPDRVRGRGR
jgi:branched-chain amino acid transport system permease protein